MELFLSKIFNHKTLEMVEGSLKDLERVSISVITDEDIAHGNKFYLRVRVVGQLRKDYLATPMFEENGHMVFWAHRERQARFDDEGPYNAWTDSEPGKTINVKLCDDGVMIFKNPN